MAYTKTNWVNGSAPALDADHLNKIEDQLELLTAAIDALPVKIQAGSVTGPSLTTKTRGDVTVAFPTAFASVPTVVLGLMSASTSPDLGSISVALVSVTRTGFTARFFNDSSGSRTPAARWVAVAL